MKRKITSFNMFINAVGINLSYTYSEIENGSIVKDNVRGTLVVDDINLESNINGICDHLQKVIEKI